jgi:F-type H+-transporting ATPase subunit c
MKRSGFLRRPALLALVAVALVSLAPVGVYAQPEAAAAGRAVLPVWHLLGAALGLGMVVIGAALGIGRLAAAAAESIARQPSAVAQITGAVNLPLFLLEGVAILAEVFVLLIVLLNGRPA